MNKTIFLGALLLECLGKIKRFVILFDIGLHNPYPLSLSYHTVRVAVQCLDNACALRYKAVHLPAEGCPPIQKFLRWQVVAVLAPDQLQTGQQAHCKCVVKVIFITGHCTGSLVSRPPASFACLSLEKQIRPAQALSSSSSARSTGAKSKSSPQWVRMSATVSLICARHPAASKGRCASSANSFTSSTSTRVSLIRSWGSTLSMVSSTECHHQPPPLPAQCQRPRLGGA